jgi:hypothetical protein
MPESWVSNAPFSGDAIRVLLAKILLGGGGGGGAPAGIPNGHYGGNPPPFTPTTSGANAIDVDTGRIWWWYSGTWN